MANVTSNSLTTIPDRLYHHYQTQPDREAIVFAHTDGSRIVVTFRQLYENAMILAKSFLRLGVKKSEFIAISLQSCPEWLYATFGAILAGARPISLSFTYTDGSDLVAMMKKLETCSVMILDPNSDQQNWDIFQKLISRFDGEGHVNSSLMPYLKFLICRHVPHDNENVLTIERMISWTNLDISLPKIDPDEIAILFTTSGSTGLPKACAHTHNSLITAIPCFGNQWTESKYDIIFNDRSFTWSGGFPWNVISGETRVTRFGYCGPPKDIVGFLFRVIEREKCTVLFILPPSLNSLIDRQDEVGDNWPVKFVGTGGQPVSKKFATCIGKLCQRFMCGYGATEFVFCCSLTVENSDDFKEYSIGYPFKGVQMKVVDESGNSVRANKRGEILVKCNGMFKEYYNDPHKTKASFTDDGWFRTDDIGFVSEDGLFFCEGRKSEMIISGGMNVAPSILESVLRNYPGVSRAVCVPVAHDVMYQVICACVIVDDDSNVTEELLRKYCEDIHNDKPRLFTVLPTYYLFLKDFPETYTGKISRKELTKLAAERFLSV